MSHVVTDTRPVIVAGARSPIGSAGGAFRALTVEDLAAPVLAEVRHRAGGQLPDDVILGNCMGPGGNIARVCSLAAGLPVEVPAMTVDRQCASGLASIATGVDRVSARQGQVLAGGVESASTAPWRVWPPDSAGSGTRYERAPFAPRGWDDPDMGAAADALASARGISRQRQDEYAARSHERAIAAIEGGAFEHELVQVGGVTRDERPRAGLTAERLARFPAAFADAGSVTAGNSCGVNDASAAVAIVDGVTARASGVAGLRVLAHAAAGVRPEVPGLGLVPAARAALQRAGLAWEDIDVIEFNEAFAGQVLACCDELGIDDARICAQGGALALGHPWGASGAVLMVRLFAQLVTQGLGRYGLAAVAAGGGQGVAVVVETCR